MSDQLQIAPQDPAPLGEELRRIRELKGMTLREVEKITGISNAYISQVETGKIEKPSPNNLYKLAEAYGVSYEQLMEKAGFIMRSEKNQQSVTKSLVGAALSTIEDLTPEEESALAEYLTFLRSRRGKGG
jgi:HTH-type transcriptional regulator, competence development regulator